VETQTGLETPAAQVVETQAGLPAVQVVETQTGLPAVQVVETQTGLETEPDEPPFGHPFDSCFGFGNVTCGGFTNLLLSALPNMSMGPNGATFPGVHDDVEHNQNLALLISPQETGDLKIANFTTAALNKLKVSGLVQ
jgi:hypothetical protein